MPKNVTRLTEPQLNGLINNHLEKEIPDGGTVNMSKQSLKELMQYCYSIGRDREIMKVTHKIQTNSTKLIKEIQE